MNYLFYFSYLIKSKIIKYFIQFETFLIWTSNSLFLFILIRLFYLNRMVDLVEKAVQVNINDNNQITQFFQYLHHIINKHLPHNRTE